MSHVTTLEELKQQLETLVCWRNETVRNCEQRIREDEAHIRRTNRQFDKRATELHTLISQMEPPPSESVRTQKPSAPNFEGLTDDEITHYKQLQERNKS